MTCSVTDPTLRVRDIQWFHVRGRAGNRGHRQRSELVQRSSNMATMHRYLLTVVDGMEGRYYCLINSAFRSNAVKLVVQAFFRPSR
jgi:hypothetical protein